ncbi:uncharacterized protein LOC134707673 [Mytilus trossulus]|uniref:uncharacterized protein LOC134707673 n=1 Tax=Mytilus trossulus TaxID=6551 RepID=UPI003005C0C3
MYREEFTRRWNEENGQGSLDDRSPYQYGRNENSWRDHRTEQYNGRPLGNNYLANGIPLPVQSESGLHGPAVRRTNPLYSDNEETRFMGPDYDRRSIAATENLGQDNHGYSAYNGRRYERRPYDQRSAVVESRSGPGMQIYRGRGVLSEPGTRQSSNWEIPRAVESGSIDDIYRSSRQPRSVANSVVDYGNVPSWHSHRSIEHVYTDPHKSRRGSDESMNNSKKKTEMSTGTFVTIRILVIFFVIWDLVNDWLLASSGPIQFLGTSGDAAHQKCEPNIKVVNKTFKLDILEIDISMCSNTNDVWTLAAVFSLLGSLLSILQVINIVMEIIKKRKPNFFQILQGHSEICFVMFFEELPQNILFTIYFFMCDCDQLEPHVHLYALLASISACIAMTLRFVTSFDTIGGEDGCFNMCWRCCCCRNKNYFCKIQPKECCCMCDMPCPLCCCTLECKMCRYTPKTWCASLLKAFSCDCSCCKEENDSYGIRLMNNFSILILWLCMAFQIVIFYSMVSFESTTPTKSPN